MNTKRYHVVVAMKPWVFDDTFSQCKGTGTLETGTIKAKDGEM